MESIDTELANKIRRDVFLGTYDDGIRLSEAQLCDTYGVSRTPVRLALRLLEREGILRRAEGRGSHRQRFDFPLEQFSEGFVFEARRRQ